MKITRILFAGLFFLFCFLPLIQLELEPIPRRRLSGLHVPKRPKSTLESFFDGSFQKKAERWFLRGHGFWGYLVRLDHQINYKLFNQISSSYHSSLLLGKNGNLFQSLYLKSFNRHDVPAAATLEKKIQDIKKLQDLLAKKNIELLVMISTNKLAISPELVPEYMTDPTRHTRKNSYELMLPLLKKHTINLLDAHAYLTEKKSSYPHPIFPLTGSHWNDVAACEITKLLVEKIELQTKQAMTHFTCSPIKVKDVPIHTDLDLLSLANLYIPEEFYRPTPYPITKREEASRPTTKPKILFVGTSFLWSILRFIEYHEVARGDLYFYFKELRRFPGGMLHPIDRSKLDWNKLLTGYDTVILEANEAILHNIGFDFVEQALAHEELLQ